MSDGGPPAVVNPTDGPYTRGGGSVTRYIVRRLLLMIPILFLVTVIVFALIHLLPGDVARMMLGEEATPQALATLREQLGLNAPLYVQYGRWVGGMLQGDFGRSMVNGIAVSELIGQRLPVTFELAILTFLLAALIAVPAGVISASRRGSGWDYSASVFALSGLSIPHFWLGMMLILFFAVRLGWLPSGGYIPFTQDPVGNLRSMILPAVATGLRQSAVLTRMVRSSLLETFGLDFVRTARAKGLAEWTVIMRHAFRNALIPVVTVSGLQIAGLLGGLVITETIFMLPGFGRLIVDSIFNRDFITVQGAVTVSAALVVLVNLLVDLLYGRLHPRIQIGGETQ